MKIAIFLVFRHDCAQGAPLRRSHHSFHGPDCSCAQIERPVYLTRAEAEKRVQALIARGHPEGHVFSIEREIELPDVEVIQKVNGGETNE